MPAEHLIGVHTDFAASVGYVEATLSGGDQAGRQAALVMSASVIDGFAVACASRGDGIRGNAMVMGPDPDIAIAGEHLIGGLLELVAPKADIGRALAGHHLGGQHFALVHGASGIDGRAIRIVTGYDGAGRRIAGRGRHPDILLLMDEHLVGVNAHLLPAKRYIKTAMRWMHLAHAERVRVMAATHIDGLPGACGAAAHSVWRHTATGAAHPGEALAHQHLIVALLVLGAAVGDIGTALAGNYLGGQVLALVEGATHIDRCAVGVVAANNSERRQCGIWSRVHPSVFCNERSGQCGWALANKLPISAIR